MKTQFFSSLPQLHVACGKDPLRPVLTYVQIKKFDEGEQGPAGWYAAATDAHILVWIRLSDYMDTNFFDQLNETELHLPAKDWKLLCKAEFIDIASDGLTLELFDKKFSNIGYIRFLAQDKMERFVKWDEFLSIHTNRTDKPIDSIGMNCDTLNRLTQILNKGSLMFKFRSKDLPILVNYMDMDKHGNDKGIIMPCVVFE